MRSRTGLFWLGILFVAIGLAITIALSFAGISSREMGMFFLAALFFTIFCGGGALMAVLSPHPDRKVLKEGTLYYGKIISYGEDEDLNLDGHPAILLNVRYFSDGKIRRAAVKTNSNKPSRYPIGSTCGIRVLGDKAELVSGSLSDMKLECEDVLMAADPDR